MKHCTSAVSQRLLFIICLSIVTFFPLGLQAQLAKSWQGIIDNQWERSANWFGGLPGPNDPVLIGPVPSGNYPEITDTRSVKSVIVMGGASLEIEVGGRLNIDGASGDGLAVSGSFTNKGDLYINNVGGNGINMNNSSSNVVLRSKTYIGNSGSIGDHGIYVGQGNLRIEDFNDASFTGVTLLNIDNVAGIGIYNYEGSVRVDEVNAGLFSSRTNINIGNAGSTSIGFGAILNSSNFQLIDGTINLKDAGNSYAGLTNRFISGGTPLFRIQSLATLNIGISTNKLPDMGLQNEAEMIVNGNLNIENTSSHGFYNRVKTTVGGSAVITIVNTDGEGIYNYDDFTNNGTINLGATSKPIDLNGIRNEKLSGTTDDVDFNNNGNINIKNVLDNGIRNMQTADFTNTGSLDLGEIVIGLIGILNEDNGSAFINDGGTIRVDNTGSQGGALFTEKTAIVVENASNFTNQGGGIIEIGQRDGNILGLGVFVLDNNSVFTNLNGQIKIDQVASSGIAIESGSAQFNNRENGELLIGQGPGNVGRDGISMGSTTVGLENEGIIKIDECGDNGIFMKGTFLNQGPAKIWIGQNAGNITEIGLFINAGASFTNKGNSELLIDNVGEEGIYLNLFNPSFLNQDNSKTIIGKNGPIGGVTHAAIKANSSTISNQDCAELKIYDFIDQANGSLLNEGFLMINTANAHTTTGSFINNGVLQFGVVNPISALVNNDLLIYNTSTGICTLSPVFVEGGTNNFNLVGSNSYLDENLTNVAANYEGATNSFNLINYPESQTNLYFEVAGNSCTFLIDMEYDPVYPAIPNPGKLTWIGGNSSAWEDGCNWLPIKVPTTDDDLIIPTSTTYPVIADGIVAQGKSLIMRTDTKLTIDYGGSLALDGASGIGANIDGKLTNNGTFSVDNTVGHGIILASRSADFLSRGDVFIGQNGSIGGAGIRLLGQGNFTINDNGTGTTDLEPTLLIDNTNSHAISSSFGQLVFKGTTLSTPVQIIVRIGALGPNSINGSGVHLATSAYTEIRGTEMYIDNALNGLQNNSGIIFYDFNSYLEVGGSGNTIPGVGVSNDDVFNHKNGIIKVSNTTSSALKDTDRFNTNGGGTLQIDGEISGVTNIRGSLLPGSSPGIITTTNDLSIANATLEIEIDGTMQGVDYDWLDVGGIATLGGTLKPVINYIPTTGDRIVFLTATSITNTFSTIDPVLPAGWGLDYSIPGEIALVFDPSIFPVELLEFDAKILGESTFLNWATASELNNDGFEIEHRTEGSIWGKVGFVFGVGNSDQVNTYEFRHLDPQMGKNYYRLKQIDFDGKYEYSKVLEINFTPSAQGMSLYPNPASDQVNIDVFRSFTIGKLQVFDLKGQLIYQTALEKNQMSSRLQTQNWASGAYQVILHIDNSLYTSKFMLSR